MALQHQFETQARESLSVLETGTARLVNTAERQEFVHLLKLGFEMIQQKARAQAAQVICEELKAVVSPLERSSVSGLPENEPLPRVPESPPEITELEAKTTNSSNVIPLRRQAGGRMRQE